MDKLITLKSLLDIADNVQDAKLIAILDICNTAAAEYCNRDSMPDEADGLIIQMAIMKFNKLGKEGAAAQSFNGVSESFIDGYTKEIYHSLNRYRKARFI
jgi:hypothetical protein